MERRDWALRATPRLTGVLATILVAVVAIPAAHSTQGQAVLAGEANTSNFATQLVVPDNATCGFPCDGLYAATEKPGFFGVDARGTKGGVSGFSRYGFGVYAWSKYGRGVFAETDYGTAGVLSRNNNVTLGRAIEAINKSPSATISATNNSRSGGVALHAFNRAPNWAAILGQHDPATSGYGISGEAQIGIGVRGQGSIFGVHGSTSGAGRGVFGETPAGIGVYGLHSAATGDLAGVTGETRSAGAAAAGVRGVVTPTNAAAGSAGVRGINNGTGGTGVGVWGSQAGSGWGVYGSAPSGNGVVGQSASGYAGYFYGDVHVTGTLSKAAGSFKIDHPLDPKHKYLSHSFVESPDMMNVYNGNVQTNARGFATVQLPAYFQALNRDFRYQLTTIGQFAEAMIAKEIAHNRFTLRTNKPNVKVSWQVTGIRKDAYANAHRIRVVERKGVAEPE